MGVTKFGSHYLPTYVPDLDGSVSEFYQKMFGQMEEMDRLGYDHIWVTEHHFAHYGGDLPHPPTFMSAIARTTKQIRLAHCQSCMAKKKAGFKPAPTGIQFRLYVLCVLCG